MAQFQAVPDAPSPSQSPKSKLPMLQALLMTISRKSSRTSPIWIQTPRRTLLPTSSILLRIMRPHFSHPGPHQPFLQSITSSPIIPRPLLTSQATTPPISVQFLQMAYQNLRNSQKKTIVLYVLNQLNYKKGSKHTEFHRPTNFLIKSTQTAISQPIRRPRRPQKSCSPKHTTFKSLAASIPATPRFPIDLWRQFDAHQPGHSSRPFDQYQVPPVDSWSS